MILTVRADDSRLFRNNPRGSRAVVEALTGRTIVGLGRRGKFMWLRTDRPETSLVIHLGMSGQARFISASRHTDPPAKHEHLRLQLGGGAALSFIDPRMFGHLTVSARSSANPQIPLTLEHIAADPFSDDYHPHEVSRRGRRSLRPVKTQLLDQGLVSGIGNIYADEGLHRARIWGGVRGSDLSEAQWLRLLEACTESMAEALQVGGTSFDSLYVDVEGEPGYFSRSLQVYGREGWPCRSCSTPLRRQTIGGRSHFFCPQCQAEPA